MSHLTAREKLERITATLASSPDPAAALIELRRIVAEPTRVDDAAVVRTLHVSDPDTKELVLRARWHNGTLTVEEAATVRLRESVETDGKFGLPFSPIKASDRIFLDCLAASLTRQFRYLAVVTEQSTSDSYEGEQR